MAQCKCSKSEDRMSAQSSPYLEEITTRMQERQCNLIGRQDYLRDKITTMERSLPALIAYNMWTSGQNCKDPLYCKVREIMKQFSPHPDPTETLLEDLKRTVEELKNETAEFHEKIIDVDVKLEEADMELESVELANKEMGSTLSELEKEVRSYSTPSLHSIHSDDLVCLEKIHQLAKEELNLKRYIKELEKKEFMFREQMDRLLTCRGLQGTCNNKKIVHCVQGVEKRKIHDAGWSRGHSKHDSKNNLEQIVNNSKIEHQEIKPTDEEQTEKKSSWMLNWWKSKSPAVDPPRKTEKLEKAVSTNVVPKELKPCTCPTSVLLCHEKESPLNSFDVKSAKHGGSGARSLCSKPCDITIIPPLKTRNQHSCCAALRVTDKSCSCAVRETACKKLFGGLSTSKRVSSKFSCEPTPCEILESGLKQIRKRLAKSPAVRDMCGSPATDQNAIDDCKCNCKGKCSQKPTESDCNCSLPMCPPSKDFQSSALKTTPERLRLQNNNSEEEFCECCSCDCDNSDVSLSCLCD